MRRSGHEQEASARNESCPPQAPQPYVHESRQASDRARSTSHRWVFAGLSAVLMALLTFVPWVGLPQEVVSSVRQHATFLGVDMSAGSYAFSLPSLGLVITRSIISPLKEFAQLGAAFGADSEIAVLISGLQSLVAILIVAWLVNMASLGLALFADITGRRPVKWAYPLLVATCLLLLMVLVTSAGRLVTEYASAVGYAQDGTSLVMQLLLPGYWITLALALGASIGRFICT